MSNPILQEIARVLNIEEECVSLASHPLSDLGMCNRELYIIDSVLHICKTTLDIEDICKHLKHYDIYFSECRITMRHSRPDYIEFDGRLYFEKCQFEYIKIPNFVFRGNVAFDACTFLQDAFFNKTSFLQGVYFYAETQFCGNVGFFDAYFEGIADFSRITFPKDVNFWKSKFGTKDKQCFVDFSNVVFKGGVNFADSCFFGGISFLETKFLKDLQLEEEIRNKDCKNSSVLPTVEEKRKVTDFSNCMFLGDVNFSRSIFERKTSFAKSRFDSLDEKNLHSFKAHHTTFGDSLDFSESIFNQDAFFDRCTFGGDIDFSQSYFANMVNFYFSKFEKNAVPNFSICNFEKTKFVNFIGVDISQLEFQTLEYKLKGQKRGIIQDIRDSFRAVKDVLLNQNNLLEAQTWHKLELYVKEIEMNKETEQKSLCDVLLRFFRTCYKKVVDNICPSNMSDFIEKSLLSFYRKISDHHTKITIILNLLVFYIAANSLFVYGLTFVMEKYLTSGTDEEINKIVCGIFSIFGCISIIGILQLVFSKWNKPYHFLMSCLVIFGLLSMASFVVFGWIKDYLFIGMSLSLVALYCLYFYIFYILFRIQVFKKIFYILSYPCLIFFFVVEPYIVAPVLGVFQEQKTGNVILEKYIQTSKFSELKDLVRNCEILNQQIDWSHDQFQQTRNVLLKHADEFLLNGNCLNNGKKVDQKIDEAKERQISIMVLKNIVLNKALKAINMIYFIVIVLLLFSLVKTARKNSIIPS